MLSVYYSNPDVSIADYICIGLNLSYAATIFGIQFKHFTGFVGIQNDDIPVLSEYRRPGIAGNFQN